MASTRPQTDPSDKPHTVPSEEVGRGPGADPEGEPLDYDENGEPTTSPKFRGD